MTTDNLYHVFSRIFRSFLELKLTLTFSRENSKLNYFTFCLRAKIKRKAFLPAGIKNEYSMLTPCESMVICNFSCVLKCSMNCSKVISPSLFSSKNRSQRVQSLPKKLDLGAMMGSEKVMKGKAKLANPFLKSSTYA